MTAEEFRKGTVESIRYSIRGLLMQQKETVKEPFPLVIMLGGYALSGKSTFCSFFSPLRWIEESTIDDCRLVVDTIAKLEENTPGAEEFAKNARWHIEGKDNKYRSLLHDIKMAWLDFDDGPNQLVLQRILNYREDDDVQIIFNNCREPEQLAYWDILLTDAGIHHFSLAINNHNIKRDLTNLGDRTTDNYIYTFYFTNDGTIENHQQQGELMRDAIVGAYKDVYGEDIFNR